MNLNTLADIVKQVNSHHSGISRYDITNDLFDDLLEVRNNESRSQDVEIVLEITKKSLILPLQEKSLHMLVLLLAPTQ